MTSTDDALWTEHLFEKHECGPYESSRTRRFEIELSGEPCTLVVPEWLPPIEVRFAHECQGLLFVVGRIRAPEAWKVDAGVVLIARRREEERLFAVHVWHELYPWALKHLALEK